MKPSQIKPLWTLYFATCNWLPNFINYWVAARVLIGQTHALLYRNFILTSLTITRHVIKFLEKTNLGVCTETHFFVKFVPITYNCFVKATNCMFYWFLGVINPSGMLGEHSKSSKSLASFSWFTSFFSCAPNIPCSVITPIKPKKMRHPR